MTSKTTRARPKRANYLVHRKQVEDICFVGEEGVKILQATDFRSQTDYNPRRGARVANILNDYFEASDFRGKRILELGPGHYAFALLARHLGATVTCIEKDPQFIKLGQHLGIDVRDMDFNDLSLEALGEEPFDGVWAKGTFNSCNYGSEEEVAGFVKRITDLVKPGGWRWFTVVNKTAVAGAEGERFLKQRMDAQYRAFLDHGWTATPIPEIDRPLYALKYRGSPFLFSKNLHRYEADPLARRGGEEEADNAVNSASAPAAGETGGDGVEMVNKPAVKVPASPDNAFNRVARLWKPTREYYPSPWKYYTEFIDIVKRRGGRFITMSQALEKDYDPSDINVLLDHHIDFYPIETEVMCRWERDNGVISSVYLFNRFDYDDTYQRKQWRLEDLNIPFYQELEKAGFEIGYHQNALGLVRNRKMGRVYAKDISDEDKAAAHKIFARDIDNLRKYFNLRTFIPHGAGEGNAQLIDLPEGYEDVTWVYNNAKRNGTVEPPLKWRNYSDSSGIATQRIRGYRAFYAARIDNLHLNAYLLSPGLNHVLTHPGRFAKGMPYELYEQRGEKVELGFEVPEFSGLNVEDIPVRSSVHMSKWLDEQGRKADEPAGGVREGKYYVLSDDVDILCAHMAAGDTAVPIKVVPRQLSDGEKQLFTVPRPVPTKFPMPEPGQSFDDAFRNFHNVMFSPTLFQHLALSGIPLDVLVLRDITLANAREADFLVKTLQRAPDGAAVHITVYRDGMFSGNLSKKLATALEAAGISGRFILEEAQTERRNGLTIRNMELKSQKVMADTHDLPIAEKKSQRRAAMPFTRSNTKIDDLNELERDRLATISRVRGEDEKTVLARFGAAGLARAPRSFSKHIGSLGKTGFTDAGVRDGMAYVTLQNGRTFYGYISKPSHQRAFEYVSDIVPSILTPETFLVGLDIAHRYATDFAWPPKELCPPEGGTVVECGAYLGHKTIRFADELVGPKGKVLAIEMMPDNVEILRHNIKENGMEDIIDVIEAGVWKEADRIAVKGKGRQRNTLLDMEKLDKATDVTARVDSLDVLLDEWGQEIVDFIFVTINGAEIEALEGMKSSVERIRAMFVAAPYERDGVPNNEVCRKILLDKGCKLLDSSRPTRIFATTPAFEKTRKV